MTFDEFSRDVVDVDTSTIHLRRAGSGPVVLLLHGFPETSLAWRKIAPDLARDFTVIAADLPGYGESTVSERALDEGRLTKRTMASALAAAMTDLGIPQFAVVGHDRGARVAYRLALDHPERIRALAVLDVLPILEMAERLTYDAAREMSHWFWLTQSSTVPETLIGLNPDLYVRFIIEQWGGATAIEPDAVDEYVRCMRTPASLRAMGAEYRADRLDLEHDRADRAAARRIACPLLVLWAQGGLTERFGDPLAIWRDWVAGHVSGGPLRSGHFLMEESPRELTTRVRTFLVADGSWLDRTVGWSGRKSALGVGPAWSAHLHLVSPREEPPSARRSPRVWPERRSRHR